MGNIFVHWANFDVDCGIFDAGICPNCGKHTFFNLQKRHKHLFLSWLCVYWSSRYFSICPECGFTERIPGKVARGRIKMIVKNFRAPNTFAAFLSKAEQLVIDHKCITKDLETIPQLRNNAIIELSEKFPTVNLKYPIEPMFYENVMVYFINKRIGEFKNARKLLLDESQLIDASNVIPSNNCLNKESNGLSNTDETFINNLDANDCVTNG